MKTFREIFNKQCGFSCDDETDRVQTTLSNIEKSAELYASQFHPSPKEISEEEIEKNNSIIEDILVEFSERESDHIADHSLRLKKSMEAVLKYHKIIEAVKPYLSLPSSGSKTEAVEFYRWMKSREITNENKGFEQIPDSKVLIVDSPDGCSVGGTCTDIEGAYQLFLKDKQQ